MRPASLRERCSQHEEHRRARHVPEVAETLPGKVELSLSELKSFSQCLQDLRSARMADPRADVRTPNAVCDEKLIDVLADVLV